MKILAQSENLPRAMSVHSSANFAVISVAQNLGSRFFFLKIIISFEVPILLGWSLIVSSRRLGNEIGSGHQTDIS
jgi:hypothetical protein